MARKKIHKILVIQHSPYRPVTWRYDRIMELVRKEGKYKFPIKGVDDDMITNGFRFISQWEKITEQYDDPAIRQDFLADLFADNPYLYYAYDIFLKGGDDKTRAALEARILARQDYRRIADALCLFSPDVVMWYENLFFNVKDRINSVDYISRQVITPIIGKGLTNVTQEISAKFFGYFAGETMLEYVLNGVDTTIQAPQPGQGPDEYLDSFFNSMLRMRSVVSTAAVEIDVYKVMPLMDMHARLIEEHNRQLANAGPKNQLEETVSALLTAIPWTVGQTRQDMLATGPLGNYIGGAAEPRAIDLMKIASGQEVPHLEDIKERSLPEPKHKRDVDDHAKQGSGNSDS